MKPNEIRIVVADDHPIFRRGLAELLAGEPEFKVIGEVQNGARALEYIEQGLPSVVVLDLDMPILDGIAVAKIVRERRLPVKVIFLTMHRNQSVVRSMNKLGVSGYVLKDAVMDEIVDCIRAVMRGEHFVGSGLGSRSKDESRSPAEALLIDEVQTLSATERTVLSQISRSKSNREIASDLCISVRTVETHRYNICSKLGIKGPHALLRFALANKETIQAEDKLRSATDDNG
ncbi:MAG TPA: response regulator transcription factor [Pyrinomonadaceae bacterium]|nr:response regulator transcription factor [Pyrinomonadaceae bacterium]